MRKKRLSFLLAALAIARCSFSAEPAVPPPPLPPAILSTLNEEYPGWKLAPVTAQIQQEFKKHKINHYPSVTSADFDHDGKRDYAVQIALTTPGQEEQIVIV